VRAAGLVQGIFPVKERECPSEKGKINTAREPPGVNQKKRGDRQEPPREKNTGKNNGGVVKAGKKTEQFSGTRGGE